MMRLPLLLTGVGAVSVIVAAASVALGDVGNTLAGFSGASNEGPLIIQIQRSSSLSQGTAEVLKQTRCLLHWTPAQAGQQGQYNKQCSTSVLPH